MKRFWDKVLKVENGCWEWQAARDKDGYGKFGQNRKDLRAHRVAYKLMVDEIPDGVHVLHRCDNPPCCNPDHLFLGTNTDNMRDKMAKGRDNSWKVSGENNVDAKLTNYDILAIRLEYAMGGNTQRKIGAAYGVSQSAIYLIVNRKNWKHVT